MGLIRHVRLGHLHVGIIWASPAFRRDPYDVLGRILDVAGFAMHTVLRVDHQALGAVVALYEFVHRGWTITTFQARIRSQVHFHRQ